MTIFDIIAANGYFNENWISDLFRMILNLVSSLIGARANTLFAANGDKTICIFERKGDEQLRLIGGSVELKQDVVLVANLGHFVTGSNHLQGKHFEGGPPYLLGTHPDR